MADRPDELRSDDEVLAVVIAHAVIVRSGLPLSPADLANIRLTVRQINDVLETLDDGAPPITTEVD